MLGLNLGLWQLRQGEAGPFDPGPALAVLATAVAWWEADDASNIVVTDAFSQLTDLSGNGNHLTQATAALRPARLDTGGIISAEFDATDDIMVNTAPTAALMNHANGVGGGTEMTVVRVDAAGENNLGRTWDKNSIAGGAESVFLDPGTAGRFRVNWNYSYVTTGSRANSAIDFPFGQIYILDARVDKVAGDTDLVAGVNGVNLTYAGGGLEVSSAETGLQSDNSGNDFSMGNRLAGDRTLNGGIYAMAFWDVELSDADRNLVRVYWALKYGITLA